jgi:hypothetical protein
VDKFLNAEARDSNNFTILKNSTNFIIDDFDLKAFPRLVALSSGHSLCYMWICTYMQGAFGNTMGQTWS